MHPEGQRTNGGVGAVVLTVGLHQRTGHAVKESLKHIKRCKETFSYLIDYFIILSLCLSPLSFVKWFEIWLNELYNKLDSLKLQQWRNLREGITKINEGLDMPLAFYFSLSGRGELTISDRVDPL